MFSDCFLFEFVLSISHFILRYERSKYGLFELTFSVLIICKKCESRDKSFSIYMEMEMEMEYIEKIFKFLVSLSFSVFIRHQSSKSNFSCKIFFNLNGELV